MPRSKKHLRPKPRRQTAPDPPPRPRRFWEMVLRIVVITLDPTGLGGV